MQISRTITTLCMIQKSFMRMPGFRKLSEQVMADEQPYVVDLWQLRHSVLVLEYEERRCRSLLQEVHG